MLMWKHLDQVFLKRTVTTNSMQTAQPNVARLREKIVIEGLVWIFTKKFNQKKKGRKRQGTVSKATKAWKYVDTFSNLIMIPSPLQNCSSLCLKVAKNWTNIAKQKSS